MTTEFPEDEKTSFALFCWLFAFLSCFAFVLGGRYWEAAAGAIYFAIVHPAVGLFLIRRYCRFRVWGTGQTPPAQLEAQHYIAAFLWPLIVIVGFPFQLTVGLVRRM